MYNYSYAYYGVQDSINSTIFECKRTTSFSLYEVAIRWKGSVRSSQQELRGLDGLTSLEYILQRLIYNIPFGLCESNYGESAIRAWMSKCEPSAATLKVRTCQGSTKRIFALKLRHVPPILKNGFNVHMIFLYLYDL